MKRLGLFIIVCTVLIAVVIVSFITGLSIGENLIIITGFSVIVILVFLLISLFTN